MNWFYSRHGYGTYMHCVVPLVNSSYGHHLPIIHMQSFNLNLKGKGKGANSSLWIGNPSQSYRVSPAIRDHTVLPATRHR